MNRSKHVVAGVAGLVFSGWMFGCVPYVTSPTSPYMNVPYAEGDTAFSSANKQATLDAAVTAIQAGLNREVAGIGAYQFVLPKRTTRESYQVVQQGLGEPASWSDQGLIAGLPVVEVEGVYVRGSKGEVELLWPKDWTQGNGPRQARTVYLTYRMGQWSVEMVRDWRFEVPASDYAGLPPAPVQEPALEQEPASEEATPSEKTSTAEGQVNVVPLQGEPVESQ